MLPYQSVVVVLIAVCLCPLSNSQETVRPNTELIHDFQTYNLTYRWTNVFNISFYRSLIDIKSTVCVPPLQHSVLTQYWIQSPVYNITDWHVGDYSYQSVPGTLQYTFSTDHTRWYNRNCSRIAAIPPPVVLPDLQDYVICAVFLNTTRISRPGQNSFVIRGYDIACLFDNFNSTRATPTKSKTLLYVLPPLGIALLLIIIFIVYVVFLLPQEQPQSA
jgi:hypothetical protein